MFAVKKERKRDGWKGVERGERKGRGKREEHPLSPKGTISPLIASYVQTTFVSLSVLNIIMLNPDR